MAGNPIKTEAFKVIVGSRQDGMKNFRNRNYEERAPTKMAAPQEIVREFEKLKGYARQTYKVARLREDLFMQAKRPWPPEIKEEEAAFWNNPRRISARKPKNSEPRKLHISMQDQNGNGERIYQSGQRRLGNQGWPNRLKELGLSLLQKEGPRRGVGSGVGYSDFNPTHLAKTLGLQQPKMRSCKMIKDVRHMINKADLVDLRAFRVQERKQAMGKAGNGKPMPCRPLATCLGQGSASSYAVMESEGK